MTFLHLAPAIIASRLAWRNLRKRSFYSVLQIGGLALGLACFLLIALYVLKESSYDSGFAHHDKIFRVLNVEQGTGYRYSGGASAIGYHAAREIPEVEEVVRVFFPYRMFSGSALVQFGDTRFYEENIIEADSNFFNLFDFRFKEGHPATSLHHQNSVVLSDRAAVRLFGTEPALGKIIGIGNELSLEVTGVVFMPENTHLDFGFLRPAHHDPEQLYVWDHTLAFTYLRIESPRALESVSEQIYNIVMTHGMDANAEYLKNYRHELQSLRAIHTDILQWDIIQAISKTQLLVILAIGASILILSVTNFVNLATARSTERIKESSISRILGASQRRLIIQFFVEFFVMVTLAAMVAILLLYGFIPAFNLTVNSSLDWSDLWSGATPLLIGGIVIVTALVSGLYPAYRLSLFHPLQSVRATLTGDGHRHFRSVLVGFQFFISITLLSATLVVRDQLSFLHDADLGFNKENVFVLRMRESGRRQFEQLRERLVHREFVVGIGGASAVIGGEPGSTTFHPDHMPDPTPEAFSKNIAVDAAFMQLMDISLADGRNFYADSPADFDNHYIINEAAVRQFGLTDPVGTRFRRNGDDHGTIIGVMKDFNFTSMRNVIGPMVFFMDSVNSYRYMFIRISGNIPEAVMHITEEWNLLFPQFPMEGFFQDEYFNRHYQQENQIMSISRWFTIIATVLAIMGLLGMCSFTVARLSKDIGIRKVIGASVVDILLMLSAQLLMPVVFAFAISVPATILLMDRWLADFAGHVSVSMGIFVASGWCVAAVTVLTIAYQSVQAARSNPAKALRQE